MRTRRNAAIVFAAAGLLGPLMQAVTWPPRSIADSTFLSNLVYDVIFYLWPARWLASGSAVDRFFTPSVLYPILVNVLVFAAIGLVAGIAARKPGLRWIVCGAVCALLVRYGLWLAGDDVAYLELLPLALSLAFCVALFWWVARNAAVDVRSAR
jgi:hypothetical protein